MPLVQAAAKLKDTLHELALEFGYTGGKVLVFRNPDSIDKCVAEAVLLPVSRNSFSPET